MLIRFPSLPLSILTKVLLGQFPGGQANVIPAPSFPLTLEAGQLQQVNDHMLVSCFFATPPSSLVLPHPQCALW